MWPAGLRSGCAVCRECGCGYTVTSDGGAYSLSIYLKVPFPRAAPVSRETPGERRLETELTRRAVVGWLRLSVAGESKHPRTPTPGPGRVCADIYLLACDPVIDNYMVNVKFLPATYALNMFNELL